MPLGLFFKLFSSSEDPNVGILKLSDYDLSRNERKEKYVDYEHIICGKCNQGINSYYYCTYCYSKETDIYKKNQMKYVGIFKTSDYDLDKNERKAKYNGYGRVMCEKCSKNIDPKIYYCEDCYNNSPYTYKRIRMKYGSKVKIFKTSDYSLDRYERIAKYKGHEYVLCEKCSQEIDTRNYYCATCYGPNYKIKILKTSDYDLDLDERRAKYKDHDVICEKCNQEIDTEKYYCAHCYGSSSKIKIFKTSDYDLTRDERKAKYRGNDHILCEKCNQKINKLYYYCLDCYYEKTDKDERNRMDYGRCKLCFKTNTAFNWCSSCKIDHSPFIPSVSRDIYR